MLTLAIVFIIALGLLTANYLAVMTTAVGLAVIYFQQHGNFSVMGNAIWNMFNSFTFTAVPVFILLGEVLNETGLAKRIYSAVSPLFQRLPGGLLQTNIGSCTIFSAISGSSTATAAVVGSIAYDELIGRGYARSRVVGSIAAGGTLGILIPPSIALIVYGAWQDVSVGALFVAGVVPGLMLASMFMVFIGIVATLNPTPTTDAAERMPLHAALAKSREAWPFLILVMAILGTIFLGLATPTESAALGVFTAIALAILYREFSLRNIWRAMRNTGRIFGTIVPVILGAVILSQALAIAGIPQQMVKMIAAAGLSKWGVMTLIYGLYLILGCFFGPLEMLLITLPVVYPIVIGLGFDPVWFGIALVIVIEIGLLTPPLGINLFVMMAVSRNAVPMSEVAVACIPYWLIMLGALALITVLPEIVLFLPSAFGIGK